MVISEDGYILTNNHVVEEVDSIFVRTFDGTRYTADLLGADPKTDVAVLKIDLPDTATADTPWRITRQSSQSYFVSRRAKQRHANGLSNDGAAGRQSQQL